MPKQTQENEFDSLHSLMLTVFWLGESSVILIGMAVSLPIYSQRYSLTSY
jgi:hypothetical protein